MKKLILFILLFICIDNLAQETNLHGVINDNETNEPITGATISIKGKLVGTITDTKGNFNLKSVALKPPFILVISIVGYQRQEINVTDANQAININLSAKAEVMNEIVFSASRVEENILESPVSIEKIDTKAIRETPSINFYDGLQHGIN